MKGLLIIFFVVVALKIGRSEIVSSKCDPNNSFINYALSGGVLPQSEVDAMKALLRSSGNPKDLQINKFSASDCGPRDEVTCHCNCLKNSCNIVEILCSSYGLSGRIPEEIGNFSDLNKMELRRVLHAAECELAIQMRNAVDNYMSMINMKQELTNRLAQRDNEGQNYWFTWLPEASQAYHDMEIIRDKVGTVIRNSSRYQL